MKQSFVHSIGAFTAALALALAACSDSTGPNSGSETSPPIYTSGNYTIAIRYVATATGRQQQAVSAAVARWQSVITQDVVDIPMNSAANSCFTGQPALNERVDDIIIYV